MTTLEALEAGRALLVRPYGISWGGGGRLAHTNDGLAHCSITALQTAVKAKDGSVDRSAYDNACEALRVAIPVHVDYWDQPLKRQPSVSTYHDSLRPHLSLVIQWWDRTIDGLRRAAA